jgi:calcineurin-like phosphoesterase family protein
MPRPTFIIGDLHFGDSDMCTILDGNTAPLRPFSTIEEHDETLINNWNKTVPKDGKVYILGDIAQKKTDISKIGRLNGSRKILIAGNHDVYPSADYLKYFKDIRATHRLDNGILMSHIPVHSGTFGKAHKLNVHAHLHNKRVMKLLTYGPDGTRHTYAPDLRYKCVSAEQIDYTPIEITELNI